jgi:hypothetical protein
MLLYKSDYLSVNYLEVQYLIHFKFKELAQNIDENTLKAEFFVFFDKMVKRKARHFLIDTQNIEQFVNIDFISWFNRTIFSLVKSIKTDKIVWLQKTEPDLDLPEIFTTADNQTIEQKLLNKPDFAMKWLLEGAQRKKLSFQDGNKPNHHHH